MALCYILRPDLIILLLCSSRVSNYRNVLLKFSVFFLLGIALGIHGPCATICIFVVDFFVSSSVKNVIGILIGIALNL